MDATRKIWDPLRRIEVALTPEEEVRQALIGLLSSECGVPLHQMMSEVKLPDGPGGKGRRADIVVYGRGGECICVVECKRPGVELSAVVLEQAVRYNAALGARCVIVSNGSSTRVYALRDGSWQGLDHLPSYSEMLTF